MVPDEIGSTGTEPAHTSYLGLGIRRVILYIPLLLVIHGDGIPRSNGYNGVD